ncbi:LamG domain-containing protein, partial [Catenulispora subtropica]|uniref:LamG domain-containing protein n=1 Tax=Catenulispora subtropica TaxID=450798 RepID=UPI0031D750C3
AAAARAGAAVAAAAGVPVALTFGGAGVASVTIQPGAEVFSDPFPVSALGGSGDLAVSLYLASGASVAAQAPQAAAVGFTAAGNQTADTAGAGSTWTALASKGYYLLSGVDVTSTDTTQGTVAVLGDQGSAAAPGVTPWADALPGALAAVGVASPGGVVNLSASGTTAAGVANSLGQRLAGWWRLSDGTAGADLVGGHPLTLSGGAAASTDHPSTTTGSVQFNGTSSVGLTSGPVLDTSQSFTVSAWAKLSSLPADNREVVAAEGTNNSSLMLGYQGSTQSWWVFMPSSDTNNPGGTVIKANPNSAQVNVWTHLTATYDSINHAVKLYVNGTLVGSASNTTGFKASGSLAVGRSTWNTYRTDYWPGAIADVQAFQQSLPAADVAVLANGGGSDLQAGNLLNAGALDEPNLRTVVLALGAGDLAHGDTASTVEANLRSLATDIKTGLKMYKGPNGDYQINVVVETVPSQGWAASDPREQARLALNTDILNGTVGDGASDAATAAASTGGDANAVQAAIAQRLAQDAAGFAVTL